MTLRLRDYFTLLIVMFAPLSGYAEEGQMQQIITEREEIQLVGICVRTNNVQERDQIKGLIFPCIQRYFHGALWNQIPNRVKPGTTFCAYTDYESDLNGDYTYFVGEEVSSLAAPLPEGFSTLVIPKQTYAKFTTQPAPMPNVIINAWNTVWGLSPKALGGPRNYQTDFEIYDERAADHQNIVLDLYIGINP